MRLEYAGIPKVPVPCACCGSEDSVPVLTGDRYGFGLRTVACGRCGLLFTSPRPDRDWFDVFYRNRYRSFYETVEMPDGAYLSRPWIRPRHEKVTAWLASRLPERGRLLDVGSAEGTFLDAFRRRLPGWEVAGVEPSPAFAAFARSHYGLTEVRTGTVEDLEAWPESTFDLVTANHLLEHLLDPNTLFRQARRLLTRGGRIFVDVPDAEGVPRGLENLHIAHVYHFSGRTLAHFFAKHGFAVEVSEKGDESPQWTVRMLGRREPVRPGDWRPPTADAEAVARAFRHRCAPPVRHGVWSTVRRALASVRSPGA